MSAIGLGPVDGDDQGMLLHATLMLQADPDTHFRPLGIGAHRIWTRLRIPKHLRGGKNKKARKKYRDENGENERAVWAHNVRFVERTRARGVEVIHVGDRETDDFRLFALLVHLKTQFVFRQSQNRKALVVSERHGDGIAARAEYLDDLLTGLPARCFREVLVSARKLAKGAPVYARKLYPARRGRTAKLAIGCARVRISRPAILQAQEGLPPSLDLNVVVAREIDVPAGEPAVEWVLYTSLPIDTEEQVLRVLAIYRARWNIETYFDALKNGCAISGRQLESFDALSKVTTLFLPIAYRLMLLRNRAEEEPDLPASAVLNDVQLEILRIRARSVPLGENPSVRTALYAVASLGGHLKHNGRPGWRTLGAGYEELLKLEIGWRAALENEATREKPTGSGRGRPRAKTRSD